MEDKNWVGPSMGPLFSFEGNLVREAFDKDVCRYIVLKLGPIWFKNPRIWLITEQECFFLKQKRNTE